MIRTLIRFEFACDTKTYQTKNKKQKTIKMPLVRMYAKKKKVTDENLEERNQQVSNEVENLEPSTSQLPTQEESGTILFLS